MKADHGDEVPFVFGSFFWGVKRESFLIFLELNKVPDDSLRDS